LTRQITYLEVLHVFDFTIKYWSGARNVIADALSRRPDYIGGLGREELEKEKDKEMEEETDKEKEVELTAAAIDMMVTSQREWLVGVREQYKEDEILENWYEYWRKKGNVRQLGNGKHGLERSWWTRREGIHGEMGFCGIGMSGTGS